MKRLMPAGLLCLCALAAAGDIERADSRFLPPGALLPDSGRGVALPAVLYPALRFPIEHGAAYAGSQFYGTGGARGPSGDSCAAVNYSYPWRDNFCELRKADLAFCPAGGHQGQDLRPATCAANVYWAVAVDDAVVVQVGRFSVTLQTAAGTLYRYVHLDPASLAVRELQPLARGARIGRISNHWVAALPIHLHFDVKDAVAADGRVAVGFVPPYASLVDAYRRLEATAAPALARGGADE